MNLLYGLTLLIFVQEIFCQCSTGFGSSPEICRAQCLSEPVDLGHGLDNTTISFPGITSFHYIKVGILHWGTGDGRVGISNDFISGEYSGTNVVLPSSIMDGKKKVGEFDLKKLITTAILIDVSEDVGDNWKYLLPASKLDEWVSKNGDIPNNCVIFIKFGWASRYPDTERYLGPSNSDLRWPGISEEAVQWMTNSKKIIGVGVDTVVADQSSKVSTPNSITPRILDNGMYELENVNLQANLPPRFNIIVMPMKLTYGVAAPARIIAY